MLIFAVSPPEYKKILFMLKHLRKAETLAAYYVKINKHLIPENVEVWEFDLSRKECNKIYP